MAVFVKIQLGDDVRRVELLSADYENFIATLKKLFNLDFEKGYRIYYIDEDKDQINITSEMELGEAINLAKKMDQTLRLTIKEDSKFARLRTPSTTFDLSASLPNLASIGSSLLPENKNQNKPTLTDIKKSVSDSQTNKYTLVSSPIQEKPTPVSHDAQCDNCKSRIYEIRYRCVNCEDFDLCETCEGKRSHREDHVFLKIYKPVVIPTHILLPNFYEIIPTTETPQTTPSETLPPKKERSKIRESLNGRFVGDVTIPDGTEVAPGEKFVKTWKFRNDGDGYWPEGTRLVQTEGDPTLSRTSFVEVKAAAPGEEIDVSIENIAPAKNGRYVSYWRLSAPNGVRFGHKVWVDVAVAEKQKPIPAKIEEPKKEPEQKPIEPVIAPVTPVVVAPVTPVPQIPIETPKPVVVEPKPTQPVEPTPLIVLPSPTNPEVEGEYSDLEVQFGSENVIVDIKIDENEIIFTKKPSVVPFKRHSFSHLKRWAVTPRGVILDFGAYESQHAVVKGPQPTIDSIGRRISSCINSLCSQKPSPVPEKPVEKPIEKPAEKPLSTEMTKLIELGFTDQTKNSSLLAKHKNDLVKVIGELLGN